MRLLRWVIISLFQYFSTLAAHQGYQYIRESNFSRAISSNIESSQQLPSPPTIKKSKGNLGKGLFQDHATVVQSLSFTMSFRKGAQKKGEGMCEEE